MTIGSHDSPLNPPSPQPHNNPTEYTSSQQLQRPLNFPRKLAPAKDVIFHLAYSSFLPVGLAYELFKREILLGSGRRMGCVTMAIALEKLTALTMYG